MADTKTYKCTDEQLAALSAALEKYGLDADFSKAGAAIYDDWDVVWTRSTDSVTVSVLKHPFAEEGFFWSKLAAALGPLVSS